MYISWFLSFMAPNLSYTIFLHFSFSEVFPANTFSPAVYPRGVMSGLPPSSLLTGTEGWLGFSAYDPNLAFRIFLVWPGV